MIAPTLFNDVDEHIWEPTVRIHHASGWNNYETCSLWDTSVPPILSDAIVDPKRAGDMVNSLVAFSKG